DIQLCLLLQVNYHSISCILPYATSCPKGTARGRSLSVRLCVISDYPVIPQTPDAEDVQAVCRCAVTLVQQGHQVYWLLSTGHMQALSNQASLGPVATDILPPTCQYVLPVQAYHWERLRLLSINQELWQHSDLHTRLFTFLCLLQ